MTSPVAIAATLLWITAVVRVPTLRRSATHRWLWAALVAVATGFTLDAAADAARPGGLPGGNANAMHLAKHCIIVIGTGAVWEVIRSLTLPPQLAPRHRPQRILATAAAVAALVVLFTAAPLPDQPLPSLTLAAVGEPALLAYWTVFLLALAAALVGIGRVARTSVSTFPPGLLRTAAAWMAAGAVTGLVYCALKAAYLVAATVTGGGWPDTGAIESVQSLLLAGTAAGFVAGLIWPPASRWPGIRHLIAHRSYRRLRPLWRRYVDAEPAIAFKDTTTGRPSLREIELRLYRRVIEIRDGLLAVRPYGDLHARDLALREAHRAGHNDPDLIGEAVWLELARRAKLHGHPPCQHQVPVTVGGADLASEIRVLTRIATSWKAIQTVADQVEAVAGVKLI